MSTPGRMSIVLVVVSLMCMMPSCLGQAPAPQLDCSDSLTDLLPCLDYVTNASDTIPQECCSGLTNVKTRAPLCLCAFISSNSSADLGINVTRALELPVFCKIDVNPAACSAVGTPPGAAPVTAPGPAPPVTPSPTTAPAPVKPPTAAPPMTVTPSPPPVECSSKIAELAPCLSFVTGQSDPPPSAECCSRLTNVVTTSPSCLCPLVDPDSADSFPGLNTTLAMELPSYCQVTVNLDNCSGGTPTTPGAGAPVPSAGIPGPPTNFAPVTGASSLFTIILVAAVAVQLLQ